MYTYTCAYTHMKVVWGPFIFRLGADGITKIKLCSLFRGSLSHSDSGFGFAQIRNQLHKDCEEPDWLQHGNVEDLLP